MGMRQTKMNRILTVIATLAVASSVVMAQGGQGGGQRGGMMRGMMGGPMILGREDVSKELKLTADQQSQLQKIFEEMRPQGGPGGGGGGGGQRGGGGQGGPGGGQRMAEMEGKIKGVLNEAQFKRYQELSLQQAGGMALGREDVQKALGLTTAQTSKIQSLNEEMREDMRGLFQGGGGGGDREAMMAEMRKLREGYAKDMLAVLTGDQNKKWQAMLGKPFKFQD